MSDVIENELSRIGAIRLLEEGNQREAAILTYEWLLKDSLPKGIDVVSTPNLYEMLSYLLDKGREFGFTYHSSIEEKSIVFTVTNNRLEENRAIPILLELLIAHIFEQQCNIQPEVTQSGNDTVVRIRLPRSG